MCDEVFDQISKLLLEKPFCKQLVERVNLLREQHFNEEDRSYEEADAIARFTCDYDSIQVKHQLRDVFEKHILSKLPNPSPLAVEDLEEIAVGQLAGIPTQNWFDDESAPYFRQLSLLWYRFPAECHVADFNFGLWSPGETDFRENIQFDDLWTSETGFLLNVCFRKDTLGIGKATGQLIGNVTDAAWRIALPQFEHIVPSVYRTVELLVRKRFPEDVDLFFDKELARYQILVSQFSKRLFSECFCAYFATAEKKTHSMQQRMRNAVHLLVLADQQHHAAVRLSLCFSAIEALVCGKTTGIVDELTRNVATLLEHDSNQRRYVQKEIKELYGLRCKTLHGESIKGDPIACDDARLLAAAVLGAAIEWLGYQRKMDDDEDRKNFCENLEEAREGGNRMIGIPDELSVCLPGRS